MKIARTSLTLGIVQSRSRSQRYFAIFTSRGPAVPVLAGQTRLEDTRHAVCAVKMTMYVLQWTCVSIK